MCSHCDAQGNSDEEIYSCGHLVSSDA
jgi:hypothetical protein